MSDITTLMMAAAGGGVEETDPNFNQTVLLLHGDGTNGAQNNTFLDSTGVHTITRNPATGPNAPTQGTFSPFSQPDGRWSNYFDGGNARLSVAANADFQYGLGDFTIEAWVYISNTTGDKTIVDGRPTNGNYTDAFAFAISGSQLKVYTNANTFLGGTISANEWTHVALTRESGTLKAWVNGTQTATTADWSSVNLNNASSGATLGAVTGGTAAGFLGYESNVRVVKGRAVYTTTFVPPTSPLGATSGGEDPPQGTETSLLTCQSNRFVDNSTNSFGITVTNSPKVTPFSPFAPTAAYDASVNGGSGYFDGTGDYLSIADAAGLRFGTGNFTIQAWIYRRVAGAVHSIAAKGGASTGWVFQVHSDNKLRFTQTTTNIDSSGTIPAGAWTHVAVVREGTGTNQTKLYINGVNDGQATVTTDFNQTEQLNIGADRGNANTMNGYIAGFKYVVGTAETITVPTAPPTGGTALLNFTNAGIFDNTGKNNLETVADAQIDTTTKKFGTGSMEFDGTGDYLLLPASQDLAMGTGDFTIEMWVNLSASGANDGVFIELRSTGATANGFVFNCRPVGSPSTSFKLNFYTDGAANLATTSLAYNTWHHVAVTRSSGTVRLFANGVSDITPFTKTNNFSDTPTPTIGASTLYSDSSITGFIDDLRITKGVARYTADFSGDLPTKEFPNL